MRTVEGFSPAGWSGSEYVLMQKYIDNGYIEVYCTAPYQWILKNDSEFKIFSYTEGDTYLTICDTQEEYNKEIERVNKWIEEQEK